MAASALLGACGGESDAGSAASTAAARAARQQAARAHRLARLERRVERLKRRDRRRARRRRAAAKAAAAEPVATTEGSTSLDSFLGSVDGEAGLVMGAPGAPPAVAGGTLASESAWSTIKVPILLRVLADAGGPAGLGSRRRELAERAITVSDNEAAAALFEGLEQSHGGLSGASAAVTGVLREAGDASTSVSTVGRGSFSTYGQTEWSLRSQYRFVSALAAGCVGGAASREYVLGLMGRVSDGWGFGALGLPARWKGGWGPGTDGRYLARQMGIVGVDGHEVVATIAAIPADGQFASAEAIVTEAARWVVDHARLAGSPRSC